MDVCLHHVTTNHTGSSSYEEWFNKFCNWTHRTDALQITEEDIDLFLEIVYNEENALYRKKEAEKAIWCLAKYYMARSKNNKKQLGRGRPAATESYKRVYELKDKLGDKISFREIGVLLNPEKPVDKSNVWHWYQKGKELLSRAR